MHELFDLAGKVAMVTGGNGGIGRGMAVALAGAGARIAVAARDAAKTADTVAAITAAGGTALGVACDVNDRASVGEAVAAAVRELGGLDILVNNAGVARIASPEKLAEEDWDAVVDTNLKAVMFTSQAAFPAMKEAGGGKVINVGSEYSIFGSNRNVAYAASKGGVVQLTKSLASSWARFNIQVNAVLPGVIETDIWGGSLGQSEFALRMAKRTPAGRNGLPEDLAGVTIFLAGRGSDYVTGTAIPVDGGFCIADPIN